MLPSSLRLSVKEFKEVFSKGSRKNGSFFLCISYKLSSPAKFAVVISKKRAKRAVIRNRIRRRVYEAIRIELKNLETLPVESKVFILTKEAKEVLILPFETLRSEIRSLL
jgi:ribonuclease P protein component